jgi:hypothetical protein
LQGDRDLPRIEVSVRVKHLGANLRHQGGGPGSLPRRLRRCRPRQSCPGVKQVGQPLRIAVQGPRESALQPNLRVDVIDPGPG